MAHFAKLDKNNNVINVEVVSNDLMKDESGVESEQLGINFLRDLQKLIDPDSDDSIWVQTSYNGNFRKQYAAIGGYYDAENDVFVGVKPYPSWILNSNYDWVSPVQFPDDGKAYYWDEQNLQWVEIPEIMEQ